MSENTNISGNTKLEMTAGAIGMILFEDDGSFCYDTLDTWDEIKEEYGADESRELLKVCLRESFLESQRENVSDPEELVLKQNYLLENCNFDSIVEIITWLSYSRAEWPEEFKIFIARAERNRRSRR